MRRVFAAFAAATLLAACSEKDVANAGKAFASAAPGLADDGFIVAQIESRFVHIDGDSALHVAVTSHGGSVRVSGRVRSDDVVRRYVAAAKGVAGVTGVRADLTADPSLPHTRERVADFALAAAVRANLTAQAGLNGIGLRIDAHDGAVTLRGTTKSEALHATLVDAARATPGVRAVDDRLRVAP